MDQNKRSASKEYQKDFRRLVQLIQNLGHNFSRRLFEGRTGLRVEDFENVYGDNHCKINASLKDYALELGDLNKISDPLYTR